MSVTLTAYLPANERARSQLARSSTLHMGLRRRMAELPEPASSKTPDRAGWIAFVQMAPVPLLLIDDAQIILAASATAVETLGPSEAAAGKSLELAQLQPAITQHLNGTFEISFGNRFTQSTIGWIDHLDPALALIQLTDS